MRKTFCDKCGKECVNTIWRVGLSVTHQTKNQEHVGEDEYRPLELCNICGEALKAILGDAVIAYPKPGPEEMMADARPRRAEIREDTIAAHP